MYKLPPGDYAAYLRKSRMDIEAEARGEEDTYAKHERMLIDMAKRHGITITEIYREKPATSGERISERPEMIRLLEDVEDEQWTGILVVEVERLARGDTMDQGIVAQAFKYSNTLIVTPMRTYDPTNPDDEEYFEFGLFMSRREFKTINRRLQGGRLTSVKEGKYVGNVPPYGYNRIKLQSKGFTLEPHPDQASIVQLIFSLYTDPDPTKRMGTGLIAKYLNDKQIPTAKGREWTVATINGMIRNPVYMGYVRWGSRPEVKKRNSKSRPRKPLEEWTLAKGLHEAIIDEVTWHKAQKIMQGKSQGHTPAPAGRITNPLGGIVRCGVCNYAMIQRPYPNGRPAALMCSRSGCENVSSFLYIVEQRILEGLSKWLQQYKSQWESRKPETEKRDDGEKALRQILISHQKKLDELQEQLKTAHDLVEQKVYTIEVFLKRSKDLSLSIEVVKKAIQETENAIDLDAQRETAKKDIIPKVESTLEMYPKSDDPAEKNALLKSILEKVVYRKKKRGHWKTGGLDQFELELFPLLPKE